MEKLEPKMINRIILCLFIFLSVKSFGQRVDITSTEQKGGQIYIRYNLEGGEGKYEIKLFVKGSNSSYWSTPLTHVSGDVGLNQTRGTNKLIVWDVLNEREKLQGDYVFGIEAVNTTQNEKYNKRIAKEIKNSKLLRHSSYAAYTCNIFNNPFGLSIYSANWKKVGWYFDVRTDFRVWAPGEWALRDRGWITGTMGGRDRGNDVVSDGGNNYTIGLGFPISRSNNFLSLLQLGIGIYNVPVYDEFEETYTGPYYAKSWGNGIDKLNFNIALVRQKRYSSFVWGVSYDTATPFICFILGFGF